MSSQKKLRRRAVWILIIILVFGFGAAITRLAYLQLVKGEELRGKAVEQQLHDTIIPAARGTIYDKNGKILAQSADAWQVIMAPIYFTNDEQRQYVAKELASILDLKEEDLLEDTKEETYYIDVKRKVNTEQKDKIVELQKAIEEKWGIVNVVALLDDYQRYYPYNDLASCVIGFVGDDGQGLSGVEYEYQDYLAGVPGRVVASRIADVADSISMPFEANQSIAAKDGSSLVLTIDQTIQSIVEKYMLQAIEDNDVYNRAVCIMMNVDTGEIYAMASVQGCNLNDPFEISERDKKKINEIDREYLVKHEYCEDPSTMDDKDVEKLLKQAKEEAESSAVTTMWRNKAVSDTYYPGSVFKMITLSMALQENSVNEDTRVICDGSIQVADKNITCTGNHGSQTYRQALENSCNPGLAQIGYSIGTKKFWDYYQGFGFSEKTQIDLPGESEDIFFSEDGEMTQVDLAVSSFGQGISITPIQMITAVTAIANGGNVVQPHVVKQIIDSNGNVEKTISTDIKRQVISPDVAKEVAGILEENAEGGTGTSGYVAGYRVAGKTGTSQKFKDDNNDGVEDHIASYGGFAPAEDPKVSCLVFFDTPVGGAYSGADVAGPVFAKILSEVLPYLEIDAKYQDADMVTTNSKVGSYVGLSELDATNEADTDGFEVDVRGSGEIVVSQFPTSGTSMAKGGTVILYTDQDSGEETATVPDFSKYSISDCVSIARQYDLNICLSGELIPERYCVSQSVKAGTEVPIGSVITLKFAEVKFNSEDYDNEENNDNDNYDYNTSDNYYEGNNYQEGDEVW